MGSSNFSLKPGKCEGIGMASALLDIIIINIITAGYISKQNN